MSNPTALRDVARAGFRETFRRWAACVLLGLCAGGCIMRTTPTAGGAAAPAAASSPATEAAESRIANLSRVDLLGGASNAAFQVSGEVKKVDLTPITVEGQPFKDGIRATVKEGSGQEWAVQLAAPTTAPIETGDAVLATFYLRTETPQEGGVGQTEFVFELTGAPYTKSIQYPVQGSAGWSKIEVRFKAARAYAAGEAHMLFRLGYDPQVIELGGIQVESFGKQVPVSALPSTQAADRRRERAAAVAAREASDAAAALPPTEGGELHFEVAAGKVVQTISPYVYGINSQSGEGMGATVRRMGGNRQSGYNWEINASNAGSDYNHSSDEWPCTAMGYGDCNAPGAQFIDFARSNRHDGMESIATVPLVDYVSADKRGAVPETEKAPSPRWERSSPKKPGPFAATPDLSDGVVYEDEFVNFLVGKLGKAAQGGIKFYSLDNEPALWPSTHPRIHPLPTRYDEMVNRSEATASAIVKLDPTAIVLGGVMFGWSEYQSLNDAPDAKEQNATYGSYLDYFLASMKRLEEKHHQRLVHALDVHWYPEARGAARVTDKVFDAKTVAARLQAPRSLWDPTYLEKSWIASTWGKPIRLIPWLQERIAARYPGTKLTMTEYNFGTGDHISGGLAQADALGVFGRQGLYLATYWGDGAGNGPLPGFIKAAFQLYRNYDGKGGAFGDGALEATPADWAKASIYAATDSKHPGALTVLVINKELHTVFNAKIDLTGSACSKARVYALDASAPAVRALSDIDVKNNQITYRLPPLSATLFVCAGH
jgi:hypothetical protein